jgi:hypothetical protein
MGPTDPIIHLKSREGYRFHCWILGLLKPRHMYANIHATLTRVVTCGNATTDTCALSVLLVCVVRQKSTVSDKNWKNNATPL